MKRLAILASVSLFVSACSGGHSTPTVNDKGTSPGNVSSTPSGGSFTESDYTCPSSDSASSVGRTDAISISSLGRRALLTGSRNLAPATPLLAVTYDASRVASSRSVLAANEATSGATFVREFDFAHTGLVTRVVRPTSGSLASLESTLRALPGVRSVAVTGLRRNKLSVSAPHLTNDTFFKGLGAGGPLYQTTTTDGQWSDHVTRSEFAFAYGQSGNGSGIVNSGAMGSSSVKIAVIDSGEDTTHPELSTKIVYQRCFITNPDGSQSKSDFETDPDGHGTGVAGAAAADTGNDFGFAGAGGNSTIYAYRVFPTPDDNCTSDTTTDDQCSSESEDIASAIEDAVSQKVNVINMSLGGGVCTTAGVDPDPTEGNAVADAIAAGIIVVAAAGNDATTETGVEAPGCDAGVIAVGATALSDGQTNSTGNTSGTASNPKEYVASYSNFGSPAAAVNSSSAWGIVAPGGDPLSDNDDDFLHWVDTIWTTTPFDDNFAGSCVPDDSAITQVDCRTLIAGTSLASPNVAGSAALIIAVNSSYQSPTKMKQLLCTTADDIGDPNEGCGRLDVYRAMAVALGDSSEPATRPVP